MQASKQTGEKTNKQGASSKPQDTYALLDSAPPTTFMFALQQTSRTCQVVAPVFEWRMWHQSRRGVESKMAWSGHMYKYNNVCLRNRQKMMHFLRVRPQEGGSLPPGRL